MDRKLNDSRVAKLAADRQKIESVLLKGGHHERKNTTVQTL